MKVEDDKSQINIYLEDKNNINNPELESKGFYPNVLVNDFPVRGKALLINILLNGVILYNQEKEK
ncbi:MAG TPA: hypothetical protein PKC55_13695 [Dysgonomonas sp.]|uniref:hypothetical protein n=1 Tax=Dysgonomonas sp. TaxID=1891233 RepID=UPI0025C15661|nr:MULTISPECIES: hypothetical protein [unclassified Dysgonomonas]HML65879.1 hypothetical protein [Dysgonomonas sp.]